MAGISGVLEVLGLAVWGMHLWSIMAGRWSNSGEGDVTSLARGVMIHARHRVGDVLDAYPDLLNTFVALGFTPLANPLLRKTLARRVTIEQAWRRLDLDEAMVVTKLNKAARPERKGVIALPMLAPIDPICHQTVSVTVHRPKAFVHYINPAVYHPPKWSLREYIWKIKPWNA